MRLGVEEGVRLEACCVLGRRLPDRSCRASMLTTRCMTGVARTASPSKLMVLTMRSVLVFSSTRSRRDSGIALGTMNMCLEIFPAGRPSGSRLRRPMLNWRVQKPCMHPFTQRQRKTGRRRPCHTNCALWPTPQTPRQLMQRRTTNQATYNARTVSSGCPKGRWFYTKTSVYATTSSVRNAATYSKRDPQNGRTTGTVQTMTPTATTPPAKKDTTQSSTEPVPVRPAGSKPRAYLASHNTAQPLVQGNPSSANSATLSSPNKPKANPTSTTPKSSSPASPRTNSSTARAQQNATSATR